MPRAIPAQADEPRSHTFPNTTTPQHTVTLSSSSTMAGGSKSSTAGGGGLVRAYLTAYNLAQTGLWVMVLGLTLKALLADVHDYAGIWTAAGPATKLAVGGAWLELVHVALGLAGGSVSSAFWQNFGRSFVLFAIVDAFNTPKGLAWLPALLLAWSGGELIRYPFYLLGSNAPSFLVWLRYSAFLLLYPLGMASEVALLLHTLPEAKAAVEKQDKFCLRLPGGDEWRAFNFYYFLVFGLLVLYPFAIPYMFFYMLKQRKKRLGGGKGGKEGGAAASAAVPAGGSKKSRKAE